MDEAEAVRENLKKLQEQTEKQLEELGAATMSDDSPAVPDPGDPENSVREVRNSAADRRSREERQLQDLEQELLQTFGNKK